MKYTNISILCIEDDIKTRELLCKTIFKFCSKLHIAKNYKEALSLYKSNKIDIIISTLRLNSTTGIEIFKKIREIDKEQYIILTISSDDADSLFGAVKFGVDDYIVKPIDIDFVKKTLTKAIHKIEYQKSFSKLRESEEKFKQISQISQMGIFIYKKKYVYANDVFCEMIGYSKNELYKMNVWDIVEKDKRNVIKKITMERLKGEHFTKAYNDLKLIAKSGEVKINRITTETMKYEGGYAGLGTTVDITYTKHVEERLSLLAQAMEQMDEMVRITDKNGNIIYVNEAVLKYTKYKRSELIGISNRIFKSNQHSTKFYKNLWDTILANKPYQGIFINVKKDGELYYEEQTITPMVDDSDNIEYFVSTSKDVTDRIKIEKKLKLLATTDGLIGIYNRYKINLLIEEELSRVSRYGDYFSLIMFDIDFFKHVNDKYGHDVGDYVLIELSKIISNSIRDTDKFGRWGGEEFMLLAPKLNKKEAKNLAQKLRKRVEQHSFKYVGRITISFGVVTSDETSSKETLLKDVDNALYEAKNSGRNKVVCI